jgi:hypothetical protein
MTSRKIDFTGAVLSDGVVMVRRLMASVLGLLLALAASPAAGAVPDPSVATPAGFRKSRGYVALAPGILLSDLGNRPLYLWGVDGGYHVAAGRRFAAQFGVFFDHAVVRRSYPALVSTDHFLGVGPQVRLGGGNARVFGYALVRLGANIEVFIPRSNNVDVVRRREAYFLASPGFGVQGLASGRVLFGGELSPDILVSRGRGPDDEGGAFILIRARMFVGVAF